MDQTLMKNRDIFAKSSEVLAGGVNSPVRAFIDLDIDPLVMEKGKGDTIYDVEGKSYIDYCMSFGTLLMGHSNQEILHAGYEQLQKGGPFGAPSLVEEKLARLIKTSFSSIEKLRFVSSGTEATMTAVRLARAASSRPLIVKFDGNYHGHADSFLVKAGSAASYFHGTAMSHGVLPSVLSHTLSLPYNDSEKVEQLLRDPYYSTLIAAVIVEPIAANMGVVPADRNWMDMLREETERIGALLIFDEVVSAFRLGFGGAQHLYGIKPDITCLGKVIGGGIPAAAIGGRKDLMDLLAPTGTVYQAGTFAGNPMAMQMGWKTLSLAREEGFYRRLVEKTRIITDPVQAEIKERRLNACVQQEGGMFTLFWGVQKVSSFDDLERLDKRRFKEFYSFLLQKGIYFPPSPYEACFISSAHTEDNLRYTLDVLLSFIEQC